MATTSVTGLELDTAVKDRAERLALSKHKTLQTFIREAVEAHVDRGEWRERLGLDAIEAWEHYQATGLHLTGEEVDAWMEKIIAGEDAELAPCQT